MNGFVKFAFSVCLILQLLVGNVLAAEEVYFYHTDPVGTPMAMSNAAGQKVWEADYKPFGEEYTLDNSPENDKRFVGKVKDEETGLNYFGARYLSAETGRFLAPDPVKAVEPFSGQVNQLLLKTPQRQNAYAYSLNNPYKYKDPDGKFAIALGAGMCAAGGCEALAGAFVGIASALGLYVAYDEMNEGEGDNMPGPQSRRGKYQPPPNDIEGIPGLERAKPKTPVQGGGGLRKRWKDKKGNIYEWDSETGALEKYNKKGKHLGEYDPKSGKQTKPPKKGREVEP